MKSPVANVLAKAFRPGIFLFSALFLLTLWSCGVTTTRPKMEMTIASAAFTAATAAKAQTLSPAMYRKAEFFFLKAKSAYRRKYFNKAKQYALLSQRYSERAEFLARHKEATQGSGAQ